MFFQGFDKQQGHKACQPFFDWIADLPIDLNSQRNRESGFCPLEIGGILSTEEVNGREGVGCINLARGNPKRSVSFFSGR